MMKAEFDLVFVSGPVWPAVTTRLWAQTRRCLFVCLLLCCFVVFVSCSFGADRKQNAAEVKHSTRLWGQFRFWQASGSKLNLRKFPTPKKKKLATEGVCKVSGALHQQGNNNQSGKHINMQDGSLYHLHVLFNYLFHVFYYADQTLNIPSSCLGSQLQLSGKGFPLSFQFDFSFSGHIWFLFFKKKRNNLNAF